MLVTEISIIIPTYRRPELFRAAIRSALAQRDLSLGVEIVVVDNDPARSAQGACRDIAGDAAVPIHYVSEPRPGISHARNAGVAKSGGRHIAFLDDDEVAAPNWLSSLVATMRQYEADIVVGPVRPRYPDGIRVPGCAKRYYERDAGLPTGHAVAWRGIGNALLNRDRCFTTGTPFDPRLGLSGGEDSLLLARLIEAGRRCVWCAEAVVEEVIPPERLEPAYLLRRAFRGGQTTAYLPSALARPRWGVVARWMLIGAAQVSIFGPWGLALRLCGREGWLPAMCKAASGLGKVVWHPSLHIRNYQLDPPRRDDSGVAGQASIEAAMAPGPDAAGQHSRSAMVSGDPAENPGFGQLSAPVIETPAGLKDPL